MVVDKKQKFNEIPQNVKARYNERVDVKRLKINLMERQGLELVENGTMI